MSQSPVISDFWFICTVYSTELNKHILDCPWRVPQWQPHNCPPFLYGHLTRSLLPHSDSSIISISSSWKCNLLCSPFARNILHSSHVKMWGWNSKRQLFDWQVFLRIFKGLVCASVSNILIILELHFSMWFSSSSVSVWSSICLLL
jgi:hypothetical protein